MQEVTLIVFLLSLGLYLLNFKLKDGSVNMFAFIVSIASVAKILTDDTFDSVTDMTVLFILQLFVFLMAFGNLITRRFD